MLQALDCLAYNGIVNRDVKPENILYITLSDGQYQFQLGDFGLCNRIVDASSHVGSPLYMAPELYRGRGQTHKVDIWSLFVTMLWTLNIRGFCLPGREFTNADDFHNRISREASQEIATAEIQRWLLLTPRDVLPRPKCLSNALQARDLALLRIVFQRCLPLQSQRSPSPKCPPAHHRCEGQGPDHAHN